MIKIFLSTPIRTFTGLLICTLVPFLVFFSYNDLAAPSIYQIVSMIVVVVAHFLSSFTISSLLKFPGMQSGLFIMPAVTFWFACALAVVMFLRFPYSVIYICIGFFLSLMFRYFVFFLNRKYNKLKMAYIPLGRAKNINKIKEVKWVRLDSPDKKKFGIKAIVVDLHSEDLDSKWQKFLAEQTLKGTLVYNVRQIEESLTGRVKIHHMYENDLGSLQPSSIYMIIKQILDIIGVILFLPITLIIAISVAIAIKLDDGGSVFYTQERVGRRGKIFKIYKFRSMKEQGTTENTTEDDDRITRVGRFIRKTRIDEIPQFINVLKGDVSLIGPRAEYKPYADELEKEVPFYQYRHIVKPGISGWAQVIHGYATGPKETQIKVEYDFYYIKHYSFSLDMLIFFKTIRTVLTGFGAR